MKKALNKPITVILCLIMLFTLVSCATSPEGGGDTMQEPTPADPGASGSEDPGTDSATPDTPEDPAEQEPEQYYNSVVGLWYNHFQFSKEANEVLWHRRWTEESRSLPIEDGEYYSGDENKLRKDFTYFTRIGIDYLIIDDTNGHFVDGGENAKNASAMFRVAEELGDLAPKICFGGGRPIIQGDAVQMQIEVDIYANYARRFPDVFFHWKGKPLLVLYTDPISYGWRDNQDRFTVRNSAGLISLGRHLASRYNFEEEGFYAWVYDDQYWESEHHGITAGWSRTHNGLDNSGLDPFSRENGERFKRQWLEAVKRNPEKIVIPSWNDHGEENGIEAVWIKEFDPVTGVSYKENPIEGREYEHLNPYIYQELLEGYLALKNGYLEGFHYQSEDSDIVYRFENNRLVRADDVPKMTAIILIPADYFDWAGVPRD